MSLLWRGNRCGNNHKCDEMNELEQLERKVDNIGYNQKELIDKTIPNLKFIIFFHLLIEIIILIKLLII